MATFLNLEARATATPKNAVVISAFTNQDVVHSNDALYHASTDRTPLVRTLSGSAAQSAPLLMKRETSTPKNAAIIAMIGDGNSGLTLVEAGRQESGTTLFTHMKGDSNGNFKSDQKHRGGVAG